MGREDDVLMGISTSGNAENVFNAVMVAKAKNIKTIILTGEDGGICGKHGDCVIRVPAKETYCIQEYHLPVYHTLCMMIEDYFYGKRD
jgi:D-sedoheptulose 7-phosphate isomerase